MSESILRGRTTVLMRTKDRPFYLERGIKSVLSQTDSDWGLVIVNDGGDRSQVEKILAKFSSELANRVRVISFPQSLGRGTGQHLNAGIEVSDSEFIAIHDDDDYWAPAFLERATKEIKTDAAVVTQSMLVTEREDAGRVTEISRSPYEPWQKDAISLFRLAEGLTFPPIALLFRRSVLKEIGAFDPRLGPLEDWEFALRLFSRFAVPFLEEPLAFYHQRVSGNGSSENSQSRMKAVYGRLDTEIRNELLRKDLESGKLGLGFLVNFSQMQGRLYKEIQDKAADS